jgi:hypothetical protein
MASKLTRLAHKIATQLHLVAESCTICSSRSRRPVRKLLDTPSYTFHIAIYEHEGPVKALFIIVNFDLTKVTENQPRNGTDLSYPFRFKFLIWENFFTLCQWMETADICGGQLRSCRQVNYPSLGSVSSSSTYEGVSKSFQTGLLEREVQMV